MIRVGLVGYGLAGAVFHAPLIRACSRMQLSAVMTSRDVADRVATLDQLLERSELVVVATPNATHFEIAKAALDAGKHVVIDKPFTATVDQADELIALADRNGCKLTVFQNRRWDSDYLTVRKILPQLQQVLLFEAHWDRFRPFLRDSWKEEAEEGNGLLPDLGSHLIDQALQLFGIPDAIACDLTIQRDDGKVNDYFQLTLQYDRMRAVLSASTLVARPRPRFAIHGLGGSFVKHGLDPQEDQLKSGLTPAGAGYGIDTADGVWTKPNGSENRVTTETGRYLDFYERIADAVLDGTELPVTAPQAHAVMRIIELANESARQGRRINLQGESL